VCKDDNVSEMSEKVRSCSAVRTWRIAFHRVRWRMHIIRSVAWPGATHVPRSGPLSLRASSCLQPAPCPCPSKPTFAPLHRSSAPLCTFALSTASVSPCHRAHVPPRGFATPPTSDPLSLRASEPPSLFCLQPAPVPAPVPRGGSAAALKLPAQQTHDEQQHDAAQQAACAPFE